MGVWRGIKALCATFFGKLAGVSLLALVALFIIWLLNIAGYAALIRDNLDAIAATLSHPFAPQVYFVLAIIFLLLAAQRAGRQIDNATAKAATEQKNAVAKAMAEQKVANDQFLTEVQRNNQVISAAFESLKLYRLIQEITREIRGYEARLHLVADLILGIKTGELYPKNFGQAIRILDGFPSQVGIPDGISFDAKPSEPTTDEVQKAWSSLNFSFKSETDKEEFARRWAKAMKHMTTIMALRDGMLRRVTELQNQLVPNAMTKIPSPDYSLPHESFVNRLNRSPD